MPPRYVAFFSYTHADDAHDEGLLSSVLARLESELRLTLGDRDVQIFQDRDDLNPGDVWETRLAKALDQAVYLIPVITPSFFSSEFCRKEFLRFWQREEADPNSARITPLYWRTHFPLEGLLPAGDDPLLKAVKAVQFDDWREVRPLGISDRRTRQKIEAMALDLAIRYGRHAQAGDLSSTPGTRGDVKSVEQSLDAERARLARQAATLRREQNNCCRAEGCIEIDTKFVTGTLNDWFKPGAGKTEWFKDLDRGPEMVVMPSGEFMMGSPPSEPRGDGYDGREEPQHKVALPKPLAVGRFAVTFDEWDAAHAAGGVTHKPNAPSGRRRQPVVEVSWENAMAYCAWLSEVTGKTYRLLSEAEWEYVCRAGTTSPFWWGSEISTAKANYDGSLTYGSGKTGEDRRRTLPVDRFEPNPWGLYQVHEWCADTWHPTYRGAPVDGAAWTGGETSLHVLRGGSWFNAPRSLRSAHRYRNTAVNRNASFGFRVAREL